MSATVLSETKALAPSTGSDLFAPEAAPPRREPVVAHSAMAPGAPATATRSEPREFAYRLATLLFVGDFLVAWVAIATGLSIREWQKAVSIAGAEARFLVSPSTLIWSLGAAGVFGWLMVMFRTYEVANLYRINQSFKNVLRSVLLWATVNWALIGLFRIEGFTPRVGSVYCMFTLTVFIGVWRLASFIALIQPKVKHAVSSRVLVVGWNERAAHLRDAMHMDLAQLREIIGCIPSPDGRFDVALPEDLQALGGYADLPRLVRDHHIHSILLADVACPASEIQRLITFCQREMIGFQLVPDYFPALGSGLRVQTLSGVPLLGVSELPLDHTSNRAMKRTIDIVGALVGLFLCLPIVPFFCTLVYLESPGPVIFRQRRMSRSGRTFFIYKIRSMRLDAESGTGAVWCKKEDPRRLRIGAFMRRWNIDELPQFINVLRGDMSLVGPRPERPELIERFKDEIPNYNARHEVRGGLTGWAQIHGLRGDCDLRHRIEADLYYLENWSVMLDLYCIVATFFKRQNAH